MTKKKDIKNKKSDFTRYREGYIAGYIGEENVFPDDKYYGDGYGDGAEDDRSALESRFEVEEDQKEDDKK